MDVEQLVQAAAAGDQAAWGALVDHFGGLVWSVARAHSLDWDDAADVSQTTWLRLGESLGSIREPARIAAWLVTCARRESLRLIRARQREAPLDPGWDARDAGSESPEQLLLREERDAELWQAIETLPPRSQALLRAMLEDPQLSYAELSAVFDIPIGSIGPTRARCLARLRDLIHTHDVLEEQDSMAPGSRRRVS
ncbi:MAG: sigma-70 family RNA polymerase sigma factor [Actinomycetota bacterium]|nr:sigma-70 family RNA polymerase sigma factor [Actinomycetota bacterium]